MKNRQPSLKDETRRSRFLSKAKIPILTSLVLTIGEKQKLVDEPHSRLFTVSYNSDLEDVRLSDDEQALLWCSNTQAYQVLQEQIKTESVEFNAIKSALKPTFQTQLKQLTNIDSSKVEAYANHLTNSFIRKHLRGKNPAEYLLIPYKAINSLGFYNNFGEEVVIIPRLAASAKSLESEQQIIADSIEAAVSQSEKKKFELKLIISNAPKTWKFMKTFEDKHDLVFVSSDKDSSSFANANVIDWKKPPYKQESCSYLKEKDIAVYSD